MIAQHMPRNIDHLTEGSLSWIVTLMGGAVLVAGVIIVLMVLRHNAGIDAREQYDGSGVDHHYGEKTRYVIMLSTVASAMIATLTLIGGMIWVFLERQHLDLVERALAHNMKLNYDIYGADVRLSFLDGSPLDDDLETFAVTVLTDAHTMQQVTAHYDTDEGIAILFVEPGQQEIPVREDSPLSKIVD